MQAPYGALSYQTPTSRNCKPLKTQLCELLLAGHKTQILNTYTQDETKVLPMNTHLKLHATQLKQLNQIQTHPLHSDLNAYLNLPRNMKATIFHNNEHTNIIISKPDITPEKCRENLEHIYTIIIHNTSVLEKTTKLLIPHPMTFIYQNKHYHVRCVQNWHSSEPTNHHSCKVTYIQRTLKLTCHNAHYACLTHMILITSLSAVNYQHNTTQHH